MSSTALKIGNLLFCPNCGTLLNLPGVEEHVLCEQCGHSELVSSYENTVVYTRSHPDAFPSALRMKKATLIKIHEGADLGTKCNEPCPRCSHPESWYREAQTRSADEGATISYTCTKCNFKWKINN
ncbi:DNA-directed RNA polymerase I kDa polypeptide [Cantharellus anzutake]|uniref:DNA-directed RNA polymerase I kDa polypeptide n=1 Tax=Cantharellus anzutake TaxID=1750568 RepID=UPI001906D690|nr:DNA-directed RNA polymerase I kDa polypeptide [Cantharellus anzutake]KAF8329091.1 DNA-directed RNA polymerase I kDa polypeptide [Cantharellus anzutake]